MIKMVVQVVARSAAKVIDSSNSVNRQIDNDGNEADGGYGSNNVDTLVRDGGGPI